MREISVKLFLIRTSGSGDVFKKIYLELRRPSCSAKQNYLCNFGRGHYGEHSCEIILNLDKWFRRKCCLKKKFTDNHNTSPRVLVSGKL